MGSLYLVSLILGIMCMLLLDHRFRLFFWHSAKAAAMVTAVGVLFLLAWDAAGIGLGIFLRGEGTVATGLLLAPELPIEEPVFLLFLVLCTMVIYTGTRKLLVRAPARSADSSGSRSRARDNAEARENA